MFRVVVASLAVAAALHAQAADVVACRACANLGALPCKAHGKAMLEKERGVEFCSVAAECKQCAGVLRIDCKECRNAKVEDELAARLRLVQEWQRDRKAKIDDVGKLQPLLHLKTAHFDISYAVKPLTVGKEKLDTHQGMHLYGERLEALRAKFLEVFGAAEGDQAARLLVILCRDQQTQQNLAPVVTQGLGGGRAVGVKLMGLNAVYCMWQEPKTLPDDDALHRNLIHNVTHLLLCNLKPELHLFDKHVGWIDEGVSHWFEDTLTGKCTNFCFEEVLMQTGASFKGGRWRAPVRQLADEGRLMPFATLAQKNTDELDYPQHAQSFALVDWLIAVHGGPKLAAFVRMIKDGKATRDALQAVYNLSPLSVDTEFLAWVKANYSPLEAR